jgi:hypothetical protein
LALLDFCEAQIAQARAIRDDAIARQASGPGTSSEAMEAFREARGYPVARIQMAVRDAIISVRDFEETLFGLRSSARSIRGGCRCCARHRDQAIHKRIPELEADAPRDGTSCRCGQPDRRSFLHGFRRPSRRNKDQQHCECDDKQFDLWQDRDGNPRAQGDEVHRRRERTSKAGQCTAADLRNIHALAVELERRAHQHMADLQRKKTPSTE